MDEKCGPGKEKTSTEEDVPSYPVRSMTGDACGLSNVPEPVVPLIKFDVDGMTYTIPDTVEERT